MCHVVAVQRDNSAAQNVLLNEILRAIHSDPWWRENVDSLNFSSDRLENDAFYRFAYLAFVGLAFRFGGKTKFSRKFSLPAWKRTVRIL